MKKGIIIIVLTLVLTCISLLVIKSIRIGQHKKQVAAKSRQLPEFSFESLGGTFYSNDSMDDNKPVLINYFSPGCEHCQYEAEEIVRNKKQLTGIEKLMVTRDTRESVLEFADKYRLLEVPGLKVLFDKDNQLYNKFGLNSVPSFLIYNKEHIFVEKILGEAKIEYLLSRIPQ